MRYGSDSTDAAQFQRCWRLTYTSCAAEVRERAADLRGHAEHRSPSMSLNDADMPPADVAAELLTPR